ncbi:MAG: efflux RND transporter permease subunit [Bdellovibrionota bacterium]
MRRLAEFFLINNKLTAMLSLFIFIAGLLGMMMLNAESFPSVNFATAIVETNYRGAAPEDIESKITKPIEDKIRTVSGLKDVRSTSQSGKSRIVVRVDMDHEDVEEVMTDLEKAVNQVSELPTDLQEDPSFTEMKSEEFPAIEIAIVGANPNRTRDKLADQLKEDLEDSKRVKNVILSGFQKREFNILLNRQKLDQYHIGVSEVLSKLSARNVDVPGGDLTKDGNQQLVRIQAKVRSADDLRQMLIRSNFSGKGVLLGDVAEVIDGSEEARFLSRYNGQPATILVVNKKGGADTIELVGEVESIINRAKEENAGKFEIVVVNNEAKKVKNRLGILSSNAVSGLVLVIVFLLLFLPGRIGVVASLSLPIAVLATFGMMPFFGMNLDAITILALVIALGMLVDHSVVISENFTRLKKEGHTSMDAAVTSVEQLAMPITATALTTIGAFLPMLVTRGIMGEFIKFIPIVVTIALVVSLVESFFLLPLRLKWAGDRVKFSADEKSRDWFDGFTDRFERLMSRLVRHRYWVGLGFSALLIGSFVMLGVANRFELFPAEQTEIYLARFEAPTGTTLEKTAELGALLSKRVEETLGDNIRGVVSKIGSSQQHPTDPRGKEGDNLGILIMYASDYAKYNIDYRVIVEKLRHIKMPEFTSLEFEEQVNGPPVGAAVNATFRSNNLNHLNTVVETLKDEVSKLPGVYDLKIDDVIGDDEVLFMWTTA